MTTASTNGRVERKSLAAQIDRLDSVLDGLADALHQAVASATREAVQAALTEMLSNPELRARLLANLGVRDAAATVVLDASAGTNPRRGIVTRLAKALWQGAGTVARTVGGWLAEAVTWTIGGAVTATQHACHQAVVLASHGWMLLFAALCLANAFRRPLLVALGVGLVIGLGSYLAGPVAASAVCGVAGFAGSLAASALHGLRRLLAAEFPLVAEPAPAA
jgi:hypothetical protein